MGIKLFDMCKAKGFYKKISDGKFLILNEEKLTAEAHTSMFDFEEIECGEEIEKTYYEYVKKPISKCVVVGFIDLIVSGWIGCDWQDSVDTGVGVIPEKFYATKRPKETVKCAIVYYANNKKHYVPVEDLEVL